MHYKLLRISVPISVTNGFICRFTILLAAKIAKEVVFIHEILLGLSVKTTLKLVEIQIKD